MLAEVEDSVKRALGVDTCGIQLPITIFGYRNEDWKPFTLFDGTKVLISGHFNHDVLANGDILQYPMGDRSFPPSGRMPKDGFYFDVLVRQEAIVEEELDAKEWVEQTYSLYTDEDLRELEILSKHYYESTDYALIGNFWGACFGDVAVVPGPHIPHPKGIRDIQEWYISTILRKDYIKEIFQHQFDLGMKNLKMFRQAVGDRIDVITISGTDFGSQNGLFVAPEAYREMFKPLHKQMNDWVHRNTQWKTFFHTCGSLIGLMDDFFEAGVDILNPVQISAAGMEPESLKRNYGDKFVFWGGGIDSQHTLPFGTAEEVRQEVEKNIFVFRPGGGFIFNNVHNIQAKIPVDNVMAMFDTLSKVGKY
jgi:hypothetical protein